MQTIAIDEMPLRPVHFETKEEFADFLQKWRVPYQDWPTLNGRNFETLWKYLSEDQVGFVDCCIAKTAGLDLYVGPTLIWKTCVVKVYYQDDNQWKELYEAKQRIISQNKVLPSRAEDFDGLGETVRRGERSYETAIRGLAQELKFTDPTLFEISLQSSKAKMVKKSEKWRGVNVIFNRFIHFCLIFRELYDPDGYVTIEPEEDLETTFKWKNVDSPPEAISRILVEEV